MKFFKNSLDQHLLPHTEKITEVVGGDSPLIAHCPLCSSTKKQSPQYTFAKAKRESKSKLWSPPGGYGAAGTTKSISEGYWFLVLFLQREAGSSRANDPPSPGRLSVSWGSFGVDKSIRRKGLCSRHTGWASQQSPDHGYFWRHGLT